MTIGMTKSSSSTTSSIIVSLIFLTHLMNGEQYLNGKIVSGSPVTVISPFIKIQASLSLETIDFKTSIF